MNRTGMRMLVVGCGHLVDVRDSLTCGDIVTNRLPTLHCFSLCTVE
jgi:hypothetical protein